MTEVPIDPELLRAKYSAKGGLALWLVWLV